MIHVRGVFISAQKVNYEICHRNKDVLRMKVGNFKKLCLNYFEKMLNFENFENGRTNIQRAHYVCTIEHLATVVGK